MRVLAPYESTAEGGVMLTLEHFQSITSKIGFDHHPSLRIRVEQDGPRNYFLQLMDVELPSEFNTGRKWRLSPHMTVSEVVGTTWKAYMTWIEHEARESFQWRGRAIYGPHLDVDALWQLAGDRDNYEYRD
jgi:hypothetical protein